MVATACRASSGEHAVVRVVSSSSWALLGTPLAGHTLTVTRIAFSPDDALLLTVSRDRGWRLFARNGDGYTPAAAEERAHARMVLDCAWFPSSSSSGSGSGEFATASRDKTVKIWHYKAKSWAAKHTIKLGEAATSVAVTRDVLAVGTESGAIEVYSAGEQEPRLLISIPAEQRHAGPVNRLAFRPDSGEGTLRLASAGSDRAVRVFEIRI